jgi:hypothetical protein
MVKSFLTEVDGSGVSVHATARVKIIRDRPLAITAREIGRGNKGHGKIAFARRLFNPKSGV